MVNEFLFGDQMLHQRFSTAIAVLARLVVANPRPVKSTALAEASGQSLRALRPLLCAMEKSGLVRRGEDGRDAWSCAAAMEHLTLADVFISVSAAAADAARSRKPAGEPVELDAEAASARQGVELLVMQATMAINQTVLRHLQGFDLGRLKAVGSERAFRGLEARRLAFV